VRVLATSAPPATLRACSSCSSSTDQQQQPAAGSHARAVRLSFQWTAIDTSIAAKFLVATEVLRSADVRHPDLLSIDTLAPHTATGTRVHALCDTAVMRDPGPAACYGCYIIQNSDPRS
jgi:hypothetical protein